MKHHTLIVGDFYTSFTPLDRSVRQKINREIRELTDVMTQMDSTDIYRTFHLNIKEYTSFLGPHGTFSKIDHILGNKANLNRYKMLIMPCILLGHRCLKLEFNSNTNSRKPTNTWKLNNAHLKHQWVKEEIKGEIKDFLKFSENDYTMYPN